MTSETCHSLGRLHNLALDLSISYQLPSRAILESQCQRLTWSIQPQVEVNAKVVQAQIVDYPRNDGAGSKAQGQGGRKKDGKCCVQ